MDNGLVDWYTDSDLIVTNANEVNRHSNYLLVQREDEFGVAHTDGSWLTDVTLKKCNARQLIGMHAKRRLASWSPEAAVCAQVQDHSHPNTLKAQSAKKNVKDIFLHKKT